jgi:tetratricopeptide (TPR) repeat protein
MLWLRTVVSALLLVGCHSPPVAEPRLRADIEQARELAARRQFADALEVIDRAVALAPNDVEARRLRVHCLAGVEAFDELLVECDRTIALGPPDAWLVYERGVALEELGRYPDAIESFGGALALDPRHYKAFQHRGWVRQLAKDHQGAVDDLTRAIELTPSAGERHQLLVLRADSLEALGRRDEAGRDRRAATDLASEH